MKRMGPWIPSSGSISIPRMGAVPRRWNSLILTARKPFVLLSLADVPPIDYIDPSGTPAGFNTAVLSEMGRRLGKNIELVQVYSSIRRSLALSSGTADAAFWTRSRNYLKELIADQSIAENMMVSDLPLKSWVALALESMMVEDNLRSSEATVIGDLPDGMIATDSYFSDPNAIVSLKQE